MGARQIGAAGRRGLTGIGTRLVLAFALMAALTALAGGASSWFALEGSRIASGLGSRSLPTVSASLTFAQRSAVLAAAAPSLVLQKDAAALDAESGKLAVLIGEQTSRLAQLRALADTPDTVDRIAHMSEALAAQIDAVKAIVARRIAISGQIDQAVADTLSAFQDLNDFARPITEATQGDVDHLLSDMTSSNPATAAQATKHLTEVAMPQLRALTGIQANGNLVNGMLAAAAHAPDGDAYNDIRQQYNWGELYLNKAVKAYGEGQDGERLAKLSASLLAAGSGKDNIFALRDARSALDTDSAAALAAMLKIATGLATEVGQLVEHEKSAAGAAVDASAGATRQSLVVNAVSSGIVVLTAVLIGWLYVGRVVIRRLDRLAAGMGRLAAGERGVAVDTAGRDEISAMAAAVQVFKTTMIRGDELAADAARHAAERATARAAADAERAETARLQSAVVEGLAAGLSRLAEGDLTHTLSTPFSADYESLRRDFNAAVSQLKSAMGHIVANADAIRGGTGEISSAADDLSRRTEQQAASLEETAAALGEITNRVRQSAEGAEQARGVVGAARADAERSGQVVRRAVEAMTGIETSSGQIGQIVGVIDEIAFQTNLLALNAGVEAARAGDAGRGFAVVASEVRALAQRSAEAAKEIKGLIAASQGHVGQGVDLVAQTGRALERIVGQVAEIDGIVRTIAASAKEQAASLGEVNAAVNQMDQVTQQNAAMVEETTAASHNLAEEAAELSRLTERFSVGDADEGVVTPFRRPARPAPVARASAPAASRAGAMAAPRREALAAAEEWTEF